MDLRETNPPCRPISIAVIRAQKRPYKRGSYFIFMSWTHRLREKAGLLEQELRALILAVRDPATPWYAKLLALAILGYAASPIDLIPDFIPVLGYLDDLILLPLGIWLVLRMIPAEVMTRCREQAGKDEGRTALRWAFAGAAILLWSGVAVWAVYQIWPFLSQMQGRGF